jgi:hypothetical protein
VGRAHLASIMVRAARSSASAIVPIARASSTPAARRPDQTGTLTPSITIAPAPSFIVMDGPARTKAIGQYIARIASTSAPYRRRVASHEASSGRARRASATSASTVAGGVVRAGGELRQREAARAAEGGVEHRLAGSGLTPQRGAPRGLPPRLRLGAKNVGLGRRARGVARGGDAREVLRERDLRVEHRRHPARTREHVERPQGLGRHVEHGLAHLEPSGVGCGLGARRRAPSTPERGKSCCTRTLKSTPMPEKGMWSADTITIGSGSAAHDRRPLRERPRLGQRGDDLRAVRLDVPDHRGGIERRWERVTRLRVRARRNQASQEGEHRRHMGRPCAHSCLDAATTALGATLHAERFLAHRAWGSPPPRAAGAMPFSNTCAVTRAVVRRHPGVRALALLSHRGHGIGEVGARKPLSSRGLEVTGAPACPSGRICIFSSGRSAVAASRIGDVGALVWVAEQLDLVALIDRSCGASAGGPQAVSLGEMVLAVAVQRACCPGAKCDLADFLDGSIPRVSCLPGKAFTGQVFHRLAATVDDADLERAQVELARAVVERFKLTTDVLAFDTTNFDTHSASTTAGTLARRGHAKSKRSDLRVVGLGMLVSETGHVPLLYRTYAGNGSDQEVLARCLSGLGELHDALDEGEHRKRAASRTVVRDGGSWSEELELGLEFDAGFYSLISLPLSHSASERALVAAAERGAMKPLGGALAGVRAARMRDQVGVLDRTLVVVESEELLKGQKRGIAAALRKARVALRTLERREGKRAFKRDALERQIAAILRREHLRDFVEIEYGGTEAAATFRWRVDAARRLKLERTRLGRRVLCTDQHEWKTELIVQAFRGQWNVDELFRRAKKGGVVPWVRRSSGRIRRSGCTRSRPWWGSCRSAS